MSHLQQHVLCQHSSGCACSVAWRVTPTARGVTRPCVRLLHKQTGTRVPPCRTCLCHPAGKRNSETCRGLKSFQPEGLTLLSARHFCRATTSQGEGDPEGFLLFCKAAILSELETGMLLQIRLSSQHQMLYLLAPRHQSVSVAPRHDRQTLQRAQPARLISVCP